MYILVPFPIYHAPLNWLFHHALHASALLHFSLLLCLAQSKSEMCGVSQCTIASMPSALPTEYIYYTVICKMRCLSTSLRVNHNL